MECYDPLAVTISLPTRTLAHEIHKGDEEANHPWRYKNPHREVIPKHDTAI